MLNEPSHSAAGAAGNVRARPSDGQPASGPLCFLHVPKSGGVSVHSALERAVSAATVSPKRQDASLFCCGFREVGLLDPDVRMRIAVDADELDGLADFPFVSGHFSRSTLLRITEASSIATVLREPRARLLSQYAFWRLSRDLRVGWRAYPALEYAERPLDEFLSEPVVARATDNLVCRMLLDADPRIPELDFIRHDDLDTLVSEAIRALETLGFVGILELGDSMWRGLSGFFGVSLTPVHLNTTAAKRENSNALSVNAEISTRTLDLIEARTAVDAIIYRHALAAAGCSGSAAEDLCAAAFANELVRFGDVAGSSASESRELIATIRELRQRLAQRDDELDLSIEELERRDELLRGTEARLRSVEEELRNHREWLDDIQASSSWRLTAPVRRAKHGLLRLRARRPRLQ
jgi:hypothetical protein